LVKPDTQMVEFIFSCVTSEAVAPGVMLRSG
jgi:hypothetical protein